MAEDRATSHKLPRAAGKATPEARESAEPGQLLRAVRDRAARLNVPAFAVWEVTRRCPLRCRHCYLAGESGDGELDPAEAKALLEAMGRLGVLFITFTGGEPLLRDDFFDIVDEALALGFVWRLLTSAAPLDGERVRRIAGRAPVAVDISLHGLEETHDAMTRVRGSWRAAVDAIEGLTGLGVAVNAKMNLTPWGLKDLSALRDFCDGLGAGLQVATRMFPAYDGTPPAGDLVLTEDQLREYLAGHEEMKRSCFGRHEPLGDDDGVCGAGRSSFSVSFNGDVRACLTLRGSFGNVRATPLRDIWRSAPMDAFRRTTAGSRSDCRDCGDAEFCSFCPGLAERETGNAMGAPPSACREARVRRDLYLRHP